MPKAASANIAHTAVTDHRIVRRPTAAKATDAALPPGELPITPMAGHDPRGPGEAEVNRDLGIALSVRVRRQPEERFAAEARERLRQATERHPRDVAAWEALAQLSLAQGEWSDGLSAAEAAVAVGPDREVALAVAADAAFRMGRLDRARDYAARAVAANPGAPDNRVRLAQALAESGRYAEGESEARAALAMCPNHPWARAHLAVCLYQQGRAPEALAELDRAAALDPRQGPALRQWFEGRTR
jgi:tetratricopeptide (TPR) repeat protein